jgi:hypothetical protein
VSCSLLIVAIESLSCSCLLFQGAVGNVNNKGKLPQADGIIVLVHSLTCRVIPRLHSMCQSSQRIAFRPIDSCSSNLWFHDASTRKDHHCLGFLGCKNLSNWPSLFLGLGGPSHNGNIISSQAMFERTSSLCLSLEIGIH